MVSGAQDSSAGTVRCPRCGAAFHCGAAAGAAECWCYEAPPVAPDPEIEACLCPRCLGAAADAGAGGTVSGAGAAGRGRSPGSR
jgi:hypothetical protein